MAQNLSEALKQIATKSSAPVTTGAAGAQATGQLRSLLSAAEGKVQPQGAAAGVPQGEESLMESAATAQTESQKRQLAASSDIAERGLEQTKEGIEVGAELSEKQDKQRYQELMQGFANRTRALLDDVRAKKLDLELDKHRALAEDIAASMRLSNERYISQLQIEGTKRRLRNQAAFQDELARATFGNKIELLKNLLGHKEVLAANDAEFAKALADIDINTALAIASAEAKAAQTVAIVSGATKVLEGGLAAGYMASSKKPTTTTETVTPTAKEESLGMSINSSAYDNLSTNQSSYSTKTRF